MISEISNVRDLEIAIASGDVIVDFARRNGCIPCKRLEPHFKAASEKVSVPMAVVYLDECDEDLLDWAMKTAHVLGTPTVLRFLNGQMFPVVERTAPTLIKEIQQYV